MPKPTHTTQLTTDSGFRLIRTFTADHNAQRLRAHCERLRRKTSHMRWAKKWKTRLDRKMSPDSTARASA